MNTFNLDEVTSSLPLRQGSKGDAVKALQQYLTACGYSVTVDGEFGLSTEAAVKQLQKACHFTVDGVVGPQTWTALVKAVAGD